MAVKMSVNLSDDVAKLLKQLADKNGVTITEQLRRSISTEVWREQVEERQGRILVEEPNGKVREIHFQR
jgi:predicted transcriptional regulator